MESTLGTGRGYAYTYNMIQEEFCVCLMTLNSLGIGGVHQILQTSLYTLNVLNVPFVSISALFQDGDCQTMPNPSYKQTSYYREKPTWRVGSLRVSRQGACRGSRRIWGPYYARLHADYSKQVLAGSKCAGHACSELLQPSPIILFLSLRTSWHPFRTKKKEGPKDPNNGF